MTRTVRAKRSAWKTVVRVSGPLGNGRWPLARLSRRREAERYQRRARHDAERVSGVVSIDAAGLIIA
jgi:hypothetical protein